MLITGIILLLTSSAIYLDRLRYKHKFIPMAPTTFITKDGLYKQWNNFPGASQDENGVRFTPIERKIVNQDGTGGQDNPAVNVGGQNLKINGDFNLSLDISGLSNGQATFRLYGELPVIYDEWRHEGASLSLELDGIKLTVRQWDGSSEKPITTKTFSISNNDAAKIYITRSGKNVIIGLDGKTIATLSDEGLFESGNLWFGASASGDEWTLNELAIGGAAKLQDPLTSAKQQTGDSLANLALQKRPSLKIGSAISLYPLMSDAKYREIALNQFNIWTPENEMKAQFIHPSKDVYAFSEADLLVATALKNGITVHGHALVFGEANPKWMQVTPKSEMKEVMTQHITAVMTHYRGKVTEWDVINEPLDNYQGYSDGLRRSIWYNAMGEDFIAIALKTARAADPDAKLYINEYGLEQDGERWVTFINLIKRLRAAGIPLDGIGFQAHVYNKGDSVDPLVLQSHIKQLADMGLASRVSETDVHGEDANLQSEQYGEIMSACLAQSSCTSFSSWGISDKYGSTTSDHTYPPEYGDDLLWDSQFNPKKALQTLISSLH